MGWKGFKNILEVLKRSLSINIYTGSCLVTKLIHFFVPRSVKKPPTSEGRGGAVEGQRAPRRNAFEDRPYETEQYYQDNYSSRYLTNMKELKLTIYGTLLKALGYSRTIVVTGSWAP